MKLSKLHFVVTLICISAFLSINAQETNAPKFGKGLFNLVGKDSTFTMKVGLRFQTLATSQWDADNGLSNPESSMLIRRSRLKFDGWAFSPKLKYKVELGLSNRDQSGASYFTHDAPRYILDAVLKWNFSGNFVLWVGQTKLPGNRERVISSANLQQVDRSLLNSRFNIDRDIGIQLRHKFNLTNTFLVKEIFSIAQGEGRNITRGNVGGHQYTTRVELFPFGDFTSKGDYKGSDLKFEQAPKLSIGVAYDFNNNASKTRSNQGSYMFINGTSASSSAEFYQTNISTVFIDAMYKHKGFSFMAEYANRTAEDALAKNSDGTLTGDEVQVGNGLNIQTGYLLSKTVEVSGRYTNISLDKNITGKGAENQYTLGLSKYIAGHKLKVQTDISYTDIGFKTNQLLYRLQVDIHF
ncbi:MULTISPECIES: porin [unclassified Polaribacter]|uniref:porin n=1 Tax=unclassified Polaribacter TaxID=196858 RepID=UPI00052C4726|nr:MULTISPECIES: porin [unclassified Polaribacter]KGL59228.1 phosphate-selective porin O and P [Polaribacter sp. Hel1_33_49]PKV63710.1 phosphate-selective porin O/P [Polaribacter sp. Hel1_33_96]